MPSVAVKLYSVFFKFLLKHRLQNRIHSPSDEYTAFGVTSRPEESVAAANPSFTDGVATKDIHIDSFTSLTVRIFLPESALNPPERDLKAQGKTRVKGALSRPDLDTGSDHPLRRNSMPGTVNAKFSHGEEKRRNSYGNEAVADGLGLKSDGVVYRGYAPSMENCRKLPVM